MPGLRRIMVGASPCGRPGAGRTMELVYSSTQGDPAQGDREGRPYHDTVSAPAPRTRAISYPRQFHPDPAQGDRKGCPYHDTPVAPSINTDLDLSYG